MKCVSVLLLSAVTKMNVAFLLAPFCGGYLEGTQQLGRTCQRIYFCSQSHNAYNLNNMNNCLCVFVLAAASSSFSSWLLSVFFSLSNSGPTVLSCKQQRKQAVRACLVWAVTPKRNQIIIHTHINTNSLCKCEAMRLETGCCVQWVQPKICPMLNCGSLLSPALVSTPLSTAVSSSWGWRGHWGR